MLLNRQAIFILKHSNTLYMNLKYYCHNKYLDVSIVRFLSWASNFEWKLLFCVHSRSKLLILGWYYYLLAYEKKYIRKIKRSKTDIVLIINDMTLCLLLVLFSSMHSVSLIKSERDPKCTNQMDRFNKFL